MRIISWNINSVRARLPRLLALLKRHEPDVVCLQETRVSDNGDFPSMQIEAAGYRIIHHGQLSHNGVAILVHDPSKKCDLKTFNSSKVSSSKKFELSDIHNGFPGNPAPNESRVVSACIGKLRLVNAYVVNGQDRESEQFKLKQRWMKSFGKWLNDLPNSSPVLIVGDFNVAPGDIDVWDPEGLRDRIHCTIEERFWLEALKKNRFHDLLRSTSKEPGYTWWPYQRDAFDHNEGLRFDLALGDKAVLEMTRRVWVDKEERRPDGRLVKPSDHAPVIVDLDDKIINA